MDRLSMFLTFMTGAVLTGSLTIAAFAAGIYSWPAVLGAAAIGFVLSWPAAYWVSRRIKQWDAGWDETRKDRTDIIPRPSEPEV